MTLPESLSKQITKISAEYLVDDGRILYRGLDILEAAKVRSQSSEKATLNVAMNGDIISSTFVIEELGVSDMPKLYKGSDLLTAVEKYRNLNGSIRLTVKYGELIIDSKDKEPHNIVTVR